jgi:hypothetical protein
VLTAQDNEAPDREELRAEIEAQVAALPAVLAAERAEARALLRRLLRDRIRVKPSSDGRSAELTGTLQAIGILPKRLSVGLASPGGRDDLYDARAVAWFVF